MESLNTVLITAELLSQDRRQRATLIKYLTDAKLMAYNHPDLYKLKGKAVRTWGNQTSRKKAIPLLNKAIELCNTDASLYHERANAWMNVGNAGNALKDITEAIRIDDKNPAFFTTRAWIWRRQKKRDKAIIDLATAIRLDPKSPTPYYHRSRMWDEKDKNREIRDLEMAIRLDKNATAESYVGLGDEYYLIKQYEKAFARYNKAIGMDQSVELWELDYTELNIYNMLSALDVRWKNRIYESCKRMSGLLTEIRDLTDPSLDDNITGRQSSVVHFTKLSVADILFSEDANKFRFYHVSFMNDPEEGKILLQILNNSKIAAAFNEGGLHEENNFYLGSFLPESHADDLLMWRTYGKDENDIEAKGCSIVVNRDFFLEEYDTPSADAAPASDAKKKGSRPEKGPKKRYDTSLHKVVYYNKLTRKLMGTKTKEIQTALTKLKRDLLKVISFKDNNHDNSALTLAIDNIVYYVITEISYFFKSADYSFENEERVILYMPPNSPLVKIEERAILPKRLYVESKNPFRKHVRKVILGPRVAHPDRWTYLKVKMIKNKFKIDLIKSNCKFQ